MSSTNVDAPARIDEVEGPDRAPRARDRRRRRRSLGKPIEIAVLVVLGIIVVFPMYFMITSAFKNQVDIFSTDLTKLFAFDATLENFKNVFVDKQTGGASELSRNFVNSLIIGGFSTLIATGLGVPAGWAYSRLKVKAGKDQLFFILSTRFLPPVVILIPIFTFYSGSWTGLYDTRLGLILLYAAYNMPFTIWMMKGFVDEIPRDYEDAAMVDGYSRIQAFWKFTLPLLIPGVAATAVFALIFAWNEYVLVTFLAPQSASTVPAAIAKLTGANPVDWGLIAASAVIFVLPVLIFTYFVRRHLVAGITFGAVRR